jgi:hypothetical protein
MHSGLLHIAQRRRCAGIHVDIQRELSDPAAIRWVAKATVFRSSNCKGFTGYGDAEPGNVSFVVHSAELRIAETRAVNRALRKAYGIGSCSVAELGSPVQPIDPPSELSQNGSGKHASKEASPGSCVTSGYDRESLRRDEIDDRAAVGLKGVVRLTHSTANGRSYQNLDAAPPGCESS